MKLLKQNLNDQAFVLVSEYLKDHPLDPQMRFWQGNLWVKRGEKERAREIFLRLTQDYPELKTSQITIFNDHVEFPAKPKADYKKLPPVTTIAQG